MVNIWLGKRIGPELEELAAAEELSTGRTTTKTDFARDLFLWALEQYREAGSLLKLKGPPTRVATNRISGETQELLFTALSTILRRAPSTVIEEVTRSLVSKAGKYGGAE